MLLFLGKEYNDVVYKVFNEKWIDVYLYENKVSGGYCLFVYENYLYIFLNYNNLLGLVLILLYEFGYVVYEYLSFKN